ncbi:hypothetical protein C8R43DRAFT_942205 [Mycena crocata]|nr:hypothetical protein C8R43DRAFT_942205 [Mycena crocata]
MAMEELVVLSLDSELSAALFHSQSTRPNHVIESESNLLWVSIKELQAFALMVKTKSRRRGRLKIPDEGWAEYIPGGSKEAKAVRHRRAQSAHYARNPHLREQGRLQMAAKREHAKVARGFRNCRSRVPAHTVTDEAQGAGPAADTQSSFSFSFSQYSLQDTRPLTSEADANGPPPPDTGSVVCGTTGTRASWTSQERQAGHTLAALTALAARATHVSVAQHPRSHSSQHTNTLENETELLRTPESSPPSCSSGDTRILEMAMQLSAFSKLGATQQPSMSRAASPRPTTGDNYLNRAIRAAVAQIDPRYLPAGVAPLTTQQLHDCQAGGLMFTRVQCMQIYLVTINSGALSRPTSQQRCNWLNAGAVIDNGTFWKDARVLQAWRRAVVSNGDGAE